MCFPFEYRWEVHHACVQLGFLAKATTRWTGVETSSQSPFFPARTDRSGGPGCAGSLHGEYFRRHPRQYLTTGTDTTGLVSRSAIEAANQLGGSNTISLPAGTYDLMLGQLDIKNNLTLTGMGASNTTINAQYTSRIFQIFSGFTVAISKVTMEDGLARQARAAVPVRWGAIFDSGALALTNDTLFENLAIGGDGADGATRGQRGR